MDGNTVHSTAFWWSHAGGFYVGGALYYPESSSKLQYNPGRSNEFLRDERKPCSVNACAPPHNDCVWGCPESDPVYGKMTNSKAFLIAGKGMVRTVYCDVPLVPSSSR
jgi:hypothetical protein